MRALSAVVAACVGAAALASATADGTAGSAGDAVGGARIAATGIAPGVVDGASAHRLVAAGVKVLDVRTPAEFTAGHVPGAVNIPYGEVAERHAEIGPASTPVLLYCQTGRRSGLAAAALRERGFTQLYDLQAYDRWVAAEATAPR